MSMEILFTDEKLVKLEVMIDFEGKSFLETEKHIMNKITKRITS